jgi:hypothetical protein
MPLYGIPHIPFLVIMTGINNFDGTSFIANCKIRNSPYENVPKAFLRKSLVPLPQMLSSYLKRRFWESPQ